MTQDERSDVDVLAAARGGDARAFAILFDRHRDRVFGAALRLTRARADAEDVTAVVFLEAWRKRAHPRDVAGSLLTPDPIARSGTAERSRRGPRPPATGCDRTRAASRRRLVATGRRSGVTVRFQQRDQSLAAFVAMQKRLEKAQPQFEALGFTLSTISGIGAEPQPLTMSGTFSAGADSAAIQRLATRVAGQRVLVQAGGAIPYGGLSTR